MEVSIIEEHGYESALKGMAYSYFNNLGSPDDWWNEEKFQRAKHRSAKLFNMGAGHNKFLRQIMVWVDINAPRYFWSEFDTYKIGTVAQSTSTMHTLSKREAESSDFEEGTHMSVINAFNNILETKPSIDVLKANLPEGFLQRRIVSLNYQTIATIIEQRWDHRLPQWKQFCMYMLDNLEHKEFLVNPYETVQV